MAKIAKDTGPSDVRQPDELLHLRQPEVVPGSQPESAQAATRAAVLGEPDAELADTQPHDGSEVTEDTPEANSSENVTTVTEPPPPTFNPGEHTVAEVNEHLDELLRHAENPEDTDASLTEFQRVVDAERADKGRVGITSRSL